LKMNVSEVWKKDIIRIDIIKQKVNSILVIWESTKINDSLLEKYINDYKNKNTTIYL